MRVSDEALDELRTRGLVRVPGFLQGSELEKAQAAFPELFPSAREYFARPRRYAHLRKSPFAGVAELPFGSLDLDLIPFHPELISLAERFLECTDVRLAKAELWAKYAGAARYQQEFHRDYGNHSLLVPRSDGRFNELTTMLYLGDVGEGDGPTELIPRTETDQLALGLQWLAPVEPRGVERMTGPAGTLIAFSYDVFHRATPLTNRRGSRFIALADYRSADAPWVGKHNWGSRGLDRRIGELLVALDPRQRELLEFPQPGHPYWNAQTLEDVQLRYPEMDLEPYRMACAGNPTAPSMTADTGR